MRELISPQEALELVLAQTVPLATDIVDLANSFGRTNVHAWLANTDLPPFHRIMMDGIAVRFADLEKGITSFRIVGIQQAGAAALNLEEEGTCLEIMTGAICPTGANAVIPYEHLQIQEGVATISSDSVKPWMNIHLKGSDFKEGEELLPALQTIGVAEIGIAASLGMAKIEVVRMPRVAIVSTGNELVDVSDNPLPHQIRRSNAYALKSLLLSAGCESKMYHIQDNKAELLYQLNEIMRSSDVLLLSGGVSKGKFDLVPEVLELLQITPVFHRIAQKPGKPMWFGTGQRHTVFAFPGNPVSTLLCAARYFIPWWKQVLQREFSASKAVSQSEVKRKGSLTLFAPCTAQIDAHGTLRVTALPNNGSGDFASLAGATGFMEIPNTADSVRPGEVVSYWPMHL
jgi:molybdopterin molybdotransferase